MTEEQKQYIEDNIDLIEHNEWDEFFKTAPDGTGQVLYEAGIDFLKYVSEITASMFSGSNITNMSIPNNIEYIGECAFYNCIDLRDIHIPNSVKRIKANAFNHCTRLKNIKIPGSVKDIDNHCFSGCENLEEVILGNGVEKIGEVAFWNCTKLEKINIPNSVKNIETWAFEGCTNLKNISIPAHVKLGMNPLAETAYVNDPSNWDNDVLYIGNNLVKAKRSLSGDYVIKNGITHIAGNAFNGCRTVTSIDIPASVVEISKHAFTNCESLTTMHLTDNVKSIGEFAFSSCYNLKHIDLPQDITTIPEATFMGCFNLTNITIPNKIVYIGNFAFRGCDKLEEVHISNIGNWLNIYFQSPDSNPLTYASKGLYENGKLVTHVTVPNGTKELQPGCFIGYSILQSIHIPKTITSIGDYAFYECGDIVIKYDGTKQEWKNLVSQRKKHIFTHCSYTCTCIDGVIKKK